MNRSFAHDRQNLPAAEVLLHVPWWVLARIILILAAVVLVVQLLAAVPGLALGALAVDVVGALGLGELVDLSTGETGEELLGELVGDWLACERKCQLMTERQALE